MKNQKKREETVGKESSFLEQQYSSQLIENMADGFSVIDLDGRQIRVNNALLKMTGFSSEELIGQFPPYPYWAPEDLNNINKAFEETLSGREDSFELIFRKKNEVRFPVIITISTLKSEEGELKFYFATIKDISARKKAEIALAESRNRFESIVKVLPDLMFRINAEGIFLDFHANDESKLVAKPIDFLGKHITEILPEAITNQAILKIEETLKSNQLVTFNYSLGEGVNIRQWEGRMVKANENEVIFVARDITKESFAKHELEKIKNFLDQTNQVARVGGWEFNTITGEITWTDSIRLIHEVALDYLPTYEQMAAFYTPNSWDKLSKAIGQALQNGTPYDFELQITTAKEKLIWVRAIGNAEFKDGKCVRLYGVLQDIDAIKKNQLKIQKNEESLKNAQSIAKLGSWELNLETNEVIWTEELYKMYGFDPSLPVPPYTDHKKLFYPESWEILSTSLEKTKQFGTPYELELKTIKSNNDFGWMWVHGEAIFDQNQKIIGLRGIAQDITERKLVDEKLRESELRFSIAIEGTEAGIWDWDMVKNKVVFSVQWKAMLGYEDTEIENSFEGWQNLWHPEDKALIEKSVADHLKGITKKYEVIHRCRHKNGEYRWIMTRGKILRDSFGNALRWIGTNVDITSQKLAEENQRIAKEIAENASRAKSEFLANMSHEIRTPLNGVIGFTDLLKNTKLNQIQQQYVNNANVSGHTLLGIINDILDFSKIEAGKLELEYVHTEILKLLENCIDIIRFSAEKKGLEVLLDIDPNIPKIVYVDPTRLKQILANLLGNAIKFTEKGEVELKVNYESLPDGKCKLLFSVRDTGIGISQEQSSHLFKAFAQADTSTTRKFGGTGLGLIISQMIAEKMGSKIIISSNIGEGSVFSFEVTTEIKEGTIFDKNKIKSIKHCLIIDDNATNRMILQRMLNYFGITSEVSENGLSALKLLEQSKSYDLIICDSDMPYIDGLETIRFIREKLGYIPEHLPIFLLLPSSDSLEIHKISKELGVKFNLIKPVKLEEMFSYLSQINDSTNQIKQSEQNKSSKVIDEDEYQKDISILIAEDMPMNIMLLKAIINHVLPNPVYTEAMTGKQALEKYKEVLPDLVFMDVQMPEMDGLEVTRGIRKFEQSKGRQVPIIALTAGAFKEDEEKCLTAGMTDFLTKPITAERIKSVLQKYLLFNPAEG